MIDKLILSLIKTAFRVGYNRGWSDACEYTINSRKKPEELEQEALEEFLKENIPDGKLFPHRKERRVRHD